MRRVRALIATCALSLAAAGGAAQPGGYEWHLPRGFPEPLVPADNPMSDAKVALGARLFTDTPCRSRASIRAPVATHPGARSPMAWHAPAARSATSCS